jgi:glycosyltransferase involved in cell wall biosynthesis
MFDDLCILYPNQIYPGKSGGYLRTFNIAKQASENFSRTYIWAVDENIKYNEEVCGIYMIQEKKYRNALDKIGYYFEGLFSKDFCLKSPDKAFYNNNNSLFQIEGPFFYNLLKKKGIKKYVLDEHNVYWELLAFPTFDLKSRIYNRLAFKRDKNIEIKALQNAAHVLVCSERDKQTILREVPKVLEKITVIPNCVDFGGYESYMKYNERRNRDNEMSYVLFIGAFTYSPNIDALHSICNNIAPNFGNDVKFIIIGRNPPNISRPKNVNFLGYVDDVNRYILESDICIAPLRYGSGTRFKILEYMAMEKPVISTTKGAEGIDYAPNNDIVIEDDINAFPEKIHELLEDKKRRDYMGKNAIKLIKQKYDWKIYQKRLQDIYEAIV